MKTTDKTKTTAAKGEKPRGPEPEDAATAKDAKKVNVKKGK
ncbi:hypothetical protein [Pedobacter sp. MC2016-14]|nr:hypothetical protein [Pedobacter sp. MC2016-14]